MGFLLTVAAIQYWFIIESAAEPRRFLTAAIFFERAHSIGKYWGSEFVDAGHAGHINAASGLGDWRFGQGLLERLIDNAREQASAMRQSRPAMPLARQPLVAASARAHR